MKKKYIYVLSEYANEKHLINHTTKTTDEIRIIYEQNGIQIGLVETNSLIEDEYCLNLKSAKYTLEGTEVKESMIHHHKKGHSSRHLQFKLQAQKQTIRIFLENLDDEEYEKCIKGFLHLSQELIQKEQLENKIKDNLINYFFNEKIKTLTNDRTYLLTKISESFKLGQMLDSKDKPLDKKRLLELREETHLKPFLEW